MTKKIIFVSNQSASSWLTTAVEAIQSLGISHIFSEEAVFIQTELSTCDLIVVDASGITTNLVKLVRALCQQYQKPIVVFTTSPTWRRAKEVILAGAVDYTGRTFDAGKLLKICQEALNRYPRKPACRE